MAQLPAPLVDPQWFAANRDRPDIKVLDATWTAPFMTPGRTSRDLYDADHIAGAAWFDIDDIADPDSELPHMLPSPALFAEKVGQLGISNSDTVIIYDSHRFAASARAWWMFRAMGHETVAVLNGGLHAWRSAMGATDEKPFTRSPPANYATPDNVRLVASIDQMRKLVQTGAAQILDARPAARFAGHAPEPRPHLQSGHMPGAISLPHVQVLTETGAMKPAADLKQIFAEIGLDLDRPIVTTCGSGVTAAVLALALAYVGATDVPVYDGSWAEWGAAPNCPAASSA